MPSVTSLRSAVKGLTKQADRDLARLWSQVDSAAAAETALRDLLPAIVDQYGAAAGSLAAIWYDESRAKRGIGGSFFADPADIPNPGTQSLVGWALTEATDLSTFRTLILGGTQRRIANFSRQTITQASIADPRARGWERVGDGNSCPFCQMLLDRGAVYTESSADFAAHDHCGCSAAPAWD